MSPHDNHGCFDATWSKNTTAFAEPDLIEMVGGAGPIRGEPNDEVLKRRSEARYQIYGKSNNSSINVIFVE